eukprot:1255051-Pyramimonas_sp.AAC.1
MKRDLRGRVSSTSLISLGFKSGLLSPLPPRPPPRPRPNPPRPPPHPRLPRAGARAEEEWG